MCSRSRRSRPSAPAFADFHFMKVVEVFPGAAASPNAQYVVLQMWTGNQTNLSGHGVTVYAANGTVIDTVTFGSGVTNGVSQDKILVATDEAATFFNLAADFELDGAVAAGRRQGLFRRDSRRLLRVGQLHGSSDGVGTPFAQPACRSRWVVPRRAGSTSSAVRPCSTSRRHRPVGVSDFLSRLPTPRNNARVNGTIPPSTCGNGVVEGVEQCEAGVGCASHLHVRQRRPVLQRVRIAGSGEDARVPADGWRQLHQ